MSGGQDARTPYRVLVGVQLLAATFALLFVLFPTPSEELRRLDAVTALLLGLGSLFTWYVAPRIRDGWGLDLVVGTITVIAIIGALIAPDPIALILVGFGFVLVSTFAAYFRPRRRYLGHLLVLIVGYGAAVRANPVEIRLLDMLVVVVITIVVSGLVAILAGQLRDQTLRDPLTGALNRRGLDLLAPTLLAGAARTGQPVSVGVIDLDAFHAFNQTHGHVAGDEMLARIATSWQQRLRSTDLLVRYGGDEFVVILPGTRADEARQVAARVRAHNPAAWTAGFVEWSAGEGLYDAIDRADREMFRHKPSHKLAHHPGPTSGSASGSGSASASASASASGSGSASSAGARSRERSPSDAGDPEPDPADRDPLGSGSDGGAGRSGIPGPLL